MARPKAEKHKQADDMVSILKQIKREYKKNGIKLSKHELNELVINKMNEGIHEERAQAIMENGKVGEVHSDMMSMRHHFDYRKTNRTIRRDGKEYEQTIFTDFPITDSDFSE